MPDLNIKSTYTPGDGDFRWLRSRAGREFQVPASIDVSKLVAGTHYDEYGVIPAGLPLGKITASGMYGPYDASATDGRQILAGFLAEPDKLEATFTQITTTVLNVAMLVFGIIDPQYVPTSPTLNTATKTTGDFIYFGVDYVAPTAG